tara:strand:- start:1837 stop:2238 length:402 start_codon:yes stop_codon:yes gene_type:complete
MVYIKQEEFTTREGQPFKMFDNPTDPTDFSIATVGSILAFTLNQFQPNPADQWVLTMPEIRAYNDTCKIFEGAPQHEGYYLLDSKEQNVAKKILTWILPVFPGGIMRNANEILALIDENAVTELPSEIDAATD